MAEFDSTVGSRSSPARAAGIGRAYALLLGARARASSSTISAARRRGSAPTPARRSRSPTRSSPPAAIAVGDTNDVSTEAGAAAIIQTALDEFGRVDIVVNNAGIIRWGDLPDADLADAAGHARRAPDRLVQRHPGGVAAHGASSTTAAS